MVTCRICKYLRPEFKIYNELMGWSLGKCMKKQSFVWSDIVPCKYFKPRDSQYL